MPPHNPATIYTAAGYLSTLIKAGTYCFNR